jgi:hypothetical protein
MSKTAPFKTAENPWSNALVTHWETHWETHSQASLNG